MRAAALGILTVASVLALVPQRGADAQTGCRSTTFVRPPAEWVSAIASAQRIMCDLARDVPGAQIAVAVDGRTIWSAGFGYADIERKLPISATTMFRNGSVSKPLTADGVALLVQDGKLDLDAPVQRYVPTFPVKPWPITPRQLGGHLSGIRHYNDTLESYSNRHYPTVVSGLSIFADDSLLFEPGTQVSYSSYGYSLLAAVVEGASGMDFPTYMRTRILDPLGMAHTSVDRADSLIPDRAQVYGRRPDGRFFISPPVDNSYKWGGGGFVSTAEDLVRFASAHLSSGRLTQASLDLLFTSVRTRVGEATNYGLGWSIRLDSLGHRVVQHLGGAIGGTSLLQVDRDSRIVVAICINRDEAPLDRVYPLPDLFDRRSPR